jgi:hypothetical protein
LLIKIASLPTAAGFAGCRSVDALRLVNGIIGAAIVAIQQQPGKVKPARLAGIALD